MFTIGCVTNTPAPGEAPSEVWTRHEVAEHLSVSITTVRRMEGRDLHPQLDARGVRLFAASEVRSVAERRAPRPTTDKTEDEGALAARVFALFRGGADLRTVVITARVHPRVVRDLYTEWWVTLNEGERRRRQALADAEDRRERARMGREHKQWAATLASGVRRPPTGDGKR